MVQVNQVTKGVGEILNIAVRIRNSGNEAASFPIGVSIGKASLERWYDLDIYVDGLGEFAYIAVDPGTEGQAGRQLEVQWDDDIGTSWDVWVTVRNPENPEEILKQHRAIGVLTVEAPGVIDAEILEITLS